MTRSSAASTGRRASALPVGAGGRGPCGFQAVWLSVGLLLGSACGGSAGLSTSDDDSLASHPVDATGHGVDASNPAHAPPDHGGALNGDTGSGSVLEDSFFLSVDLTRNPRHALSALVTVVTAEPAEVWLEVAGAGQRTRQTRSSPRGTEHEILVMGMRASSDYTLTPVARAAHGGEHRAKGSVFRTDELPVNLPSYDVNVASPDEVSDGVVLLGINASSGAGATRDSDEAFYIGLDEAGEVVWYFHDPGLTRGQNDRFVKQLSSGNYLLSLPRELRVVTPDGVTVSSISDAGKGGDGEDYNFHHDAAERPDGGLVVLANETRQLEVAALGGMVALKGDVLLEFDTMGQRVWQWHAFDHLDTERFPGQLSQKSGPGGDGAIDWTHGNAVTYTPDGQALLLSLRHQNWVLKIDRATGEVLWRLGPGGDFSLAPQDSPEDWFYSQHNPRISDTGELWVYDNGNERPGFASPYSRALRFSLDESSYSAAITWSYKTTHYTGFLGGLQPVGDDHVLICAGGIQRGPGRGSQSANGEALVSEVTVDGEGRVLWRLSSPGAIYRALKVTTL